MRRIWWVIAVLVVAGVLTLALRKREPPQLPFARIKRQTVVSTLPTNGKLEPIEWESVRAETSGLIVSVPVSEGDSVNAGAVIAQISQPGVQEELNSAEARAAQFRSSLDILMKGGSSSLVAELDAGIAKAKFDRDVARRDVDALSRMEAKQAATHFEVLTASTPPNSPSKRLPNAATHWSAPTMSPPAARVWRRPRRTLIPRAKNSSPVSYVRP